MLNIDKLRYTYEKPFLELMEGMERGVHPKYPNYILWYKNNEWYFEQNEKNGIFWCQINRVWSFFETNYSPKYSEIQVIIRDLMERHYKLKGLTPFNVNFKITLLMERHYKLKGLTPKGDYAEPMRRMERHYKLNGLTPSSKMMGIHYKYFLKKC